MSPKIKGCFKKEDNDEALECVITELKNQKNEACPARLVFLYSENCAPCKEEEERHKEAIKSGLIKKISIESPEGMEISFKNDVGFTPALLPLDCHNVIISED